MEHGAHNIMIVAGEYRDTSSRLPIPNTNRLIVRCAQYPWILMMEKCCTDIVQMSKQCEYAAAFFVVPELPNNVKWVQLIKDY